MGGSSRCCEVEHSPPARESPTTRKGGACRAPAGPGREGDHGDRRSEVARGEPGPVRPDRLAPCAPHQPALERARKERDLPRVERRGRGAGGVASAAERPRGGALEETI